MALNTACLDKLNLELECSICSEPFQDPRVLVCQHVFCVACLAKLGRGEKIITCPICRQDTLISTGEGVSALPKPFILNNLRDTLDSFIEKEVRSTKGSDRLCALCELNQPNRATLFCKECLEHMCVACFDSHLAISGFQNHLATATDELTHCDVHSPNICMVWCVDCSVPVCVKCLLSSHNRHITKDIKVAITEEKLLLQGKFKLCEKKLESIRSDLIKHSTEDSKMTAAFETSMQSVLEWSEKFINQVQVVTNQLVTKLENAKQENSDQIQKRKTTFDALLEQIQHKKEELEFALESTSPKEVVGSSQRLGNVPTKTVNCPQIITFKMPTISVVDFKVNDLCKCEFSDVATDTETPDMELRVDETMCKSQQIQTSSVPEVALPSVTALTPVAGLSETGIGSWKVMKKIAFPVKNIIDIICALDESKIYSRMKNTKDEEVLGIISLEGKSLKSVVLNVYGYDSGMAYDSKRKLVILGYKPNEFETFSTEGDFQAKRTLEKLTDNSRFVYCESIDSLAVVDNKSSKVHVIECTEYQISISFNAQAPAYIDFDNNSETIVISSSTKSEVCLYDKLGMLRYRVNHSSLSTRCGICFISASVLLGSNRQYDRTVIWAIKLNDTGNHAVQHVLTRSAISNNVSDVIKITAKRAVIGSPQHLIFIERK